MVNNKGEPAKTEKTWEDFVRALPKMEKNMLKETCFQIVNFEIN